MERDGTGQLSTIYTYGNQRINSESYNNLSGLYTYDGRGSVSAVIGGYGDFRASYWYDGLGNVKSQIHGYGAFGSGKKYYGYNAEQYNLVTGNQNLRNRQLNIRRQTKIWDGVAYFLHILYIIFLKKLGTGLHISDTFKTQNLWKKS